MVADPGNDRFSEQAHEIEKMLVGKGGRPPRSATG